MKILPNELIEENLTPYVLLQRAYPNKMTWQTNSNVLKKIVCDYLQHILEGNRILVENQKQDMLQTGQKLHYKRHFYDADFEDRINELVRRAKADPDWIDSVLTTLVAKLMDRTKLAKSNPDYIQSTMVNNSLKPLKKLFSMSSAKMAWGKIDTMITDENDIKDQSRGYTLEEIQTICKFCDPMERVMVKLGSSSGIRAGAFDLNWGHILPVYQNSDEKFIWLPEELTESISNNCKIVCGIIVVYADSTSEYYGFVTPEWLNDLEIYKQLWIKETNTVPKDQDPLFKKAGPFVRRLSPSGIRSRMTRIVEDASVRTHIPGIKSKYNVPIFNGTRRFFNKQNKLAVSNTSLLAQLIFKEYQMGHNGLIKLDKNYFKEHVHELISEYQTTVPFVTISNEERTQLELQKVKAKITKERDTEIKLEILTEELYDLKHKFEIRKTP